jgi:hypothetical protein
MFCYSRGMFKINDNSDGPFFLRSTTHVVLLTIVTFGIYPVLWFYKAFESLKESREKENKTTPSIWWALMSIFTSHIYFNAVYKQYEKVDGYKAHAWFNQPVVLSGLFFVTTLLISPLSFIPLLIAQNMVKEIRVAGVEFVDFEKAETQNDESKEWKDF